MKTIVREAVSNDPYVTITQKSRKDWRVELHHKGYDNYWWCTDPSGVYDRARSEERAIAKGKKMLDKYNRKYGNLKGTITIQ